MAGQLDPPDPALVGQLGTHLVELARLLATGDGTVGPERIVHFATRALEHSDDCGLTVVPRHRRLETASAAGALAPRVDVLQFETGEGPCLDAAEHGDFVRADDLASDDRWPAFGPRCVAETGVQSMLSIRVPLGEQEHVALNFYATRAAAFDDQDVGVGALLAPFVAMAFRAGEQQEKAVNLEAALRSSRQIGIAVGVLMARDLVTADEAFRRLAAASQHLNRRVRDLAEEVAQTGTLPEAPARGRKRGRPGPPRS